MEKLLKSVHWTDLISEPNCFDEQQIIEVLRKLAGRTEQPVLFTMAAIEILIEGCCSEIIRRSLCKHPPAPEAIEATLTLKNRLQGVFRDVLKNSPQWRLIYGPRRTEYRGIASGRTDTE